MAEFSEPILYNDYAIRIGRVEHLIFAEIRRQDGKRFALMTISGRILTTDRCYASEDEAIADAKKAIDNACALPSTPRRLKYE